MAWIFCSIKKEQWTYLAVLQSYDRAILSKKKKIVFLTSDKIVEYIKLTCHNIICDLKVSSTYDSYM